MAENVTVNFFRILEWIKYIRSPSELKIEYLFKRRIFIAIILIEAIEVALSPLHYCTSFTGDSSK